MATRKLTPFQQAFANARADGKSEFEFNGKKYHTRRADNKPLPARRSEVDPDIAGMPMTKEQSEGVMSRMASRAKAAAGENTEELSDMTYRKGGAVKKMASGGYVKAADGIAKRGKTRGKMC